MTWKDLFNELPSTFEAILSSGRIHGRRPKVIPPILALYEVHSVGRVRGMVIQEVRFYLVFNAVCGADLIILKVKMLRWIQIYK